MKQAIKNWTRIGMGACLAAVLAACGGGGADGDADEVAVSVRVEGLSASDVAVADDLGHAVVLSANGVQSFARMATGTRFTPTITAQPSNQVCRMDAGVRTATRGLELLVRCEAGLLTTSGLRSHSVDQVVMVDTQEPGLPGSVTLGGVAVTPLEATTGGFTFRVPELAAGAHELRAVVNGRAFSAMLDITANPLTETPDVFLRRAAADALADIAASLADPATTEEERADLLQLQTALGGLDGALATASPADIQNLARLLAANDPDRWLAAGDPVSPARVDVSAVSGRVSAAAVEPNVVLCERHSNRLSVSVSATVALMALTNMSATSGLGLPLTALSAVGYIYTIKMAMNDAGGVVDHCVGIVSMPILKVLSVVRTSAQSKDLASGSVAAQSLLRIQAQAVTSMAFNHGEAGVLEVQLEKALLAQVKDRLLTAISRLASLHSTVSDAVSEVVTLPGADLVARLRTLQRSYSEPAQALSLEGLPAGITGDIAPMLDGQGQPTGRYTVVFRSSTEPTSIAPIPFSFRLRETEADYLGPVINATLQLPLTPVASDLAFETNLDTTLNARLTATHATGFTLLDPPASGSLTLTDANTGAFTYTPSTGFSGTVSFTYRASNERATSQTATVVIAVLGAQVQCALRDNSDSFALAYRRECAHYLASGAATDEGFWSSALPDGLPGFWRIGDEQSYESLYENFVLSPGLSAQVTIQGVAHDAVNQQFTLDRSVGEYVPETGALAQPSPTFTGQGDDLRMQSQRERVTFRKHPISGLFIVDAVQRALLQRSYLVNETVVVDRLERVTATLQALDAQGAPTYATETIRCWRPTALDSGGYSLTSGAEWSVERVTTTNRTETSRSFTTDGVCPLSASTLLDGVGPEKGLNDLSFDWRNPPLTSGG